MESNQFPSLSNIREGVWDYLKNNLNQTNNMKFVDDSQNVVYNGILIGFKMRTLPEDKKMLLSFFPYGQNTVYWSKSKNIEAVKTVLEFCNTLGEEIIAKSEAGSFIFEREAIDIKSIIDINDWEVVLASKSPLEKISLKELLNKVKTTKYDFIFNTIPKNNEFLIFTQSFLGDKRPVETLKEFLEIFGEVKGPRSLITAKEFVEKHHPHRDSSACIFVENSSLLEQWYKTQKVYFDSNRIPSQYIEDTTVFDKLAKWPGIQANLIMEIMTKMGKKPIILRAPEEIMTSEGFLCLSDIEITTKNLFGALFTYSKEGLEKEEEVQIYEDIEFTIHKETIEIPYEKIDILSERIRNLIGRKIAIDIIITKEWNLEKLKRLIVKLKDAEIMINRVYYVSSKTSRFTDSFLINGFVDKTKFPYLRIGEKVVFLRSSTELRIYANISHLFIRLMWPENEVLKDDDLKKILWLVKKRLYRIQEFGVLKIPEPIQYSEI